MKIVFFLAFFLLFSSFSFASVELLFPLNEGVSSDSPLFLGYVSPGQSFDVVFSDDSRLGFDWDYIEVERSSLPRLWSVVSYNKTDSSLSATLRVPSSFPEGSYSFAVLVVNSERGVFEKVNFLVGIKNGLVSVSFSKPVSEDKLFVGSSINYLVSVSNSSIGYDEVFISANVPSNWFSSKRVSLRPKEELELPLVVVPKYYGSKSLRFTASLLSSNSQISYFDSEFYVEPSLKGKLGSALSGFPFFTFSLLPFQLLSSLLG